MRAMEQHSRPRTCWCAPRLWGVHWTDVTITDRLPRAFAPSFCFFEGDRITHTQGSAPSKSVILCTGSTARFDLRTGWLAYPHCAAVRRLLHAPSRLGLHASRTMPTPSPKVDAALRIALDQWCALIGEENVYRSGARLEELRLDTSDFKQSFHARLRPSDRTQIPALITIAQQCAISVYPISGGHNWGYGTANPVRPGGVILDLGALKEISVNVELGTATVEPGVSQQDLYGFLEARGLPFIVPTSGAGPNGSILGNALERGFGLTPYADHFAAVTRIEAVFPDGTLYTSPLSGLGGTEVDECFKWGVGPYFEGLFSQGNFAIVTRVTVALARKCEQTSIVVFSLTDSRLDLAVDAVRDIMATVGGNIGGFNLMNRARVLTMAQRSTDDRSAALIVGKKTVPDWTGAGAVYGTTRVARAVCSEIKRILRPTDSAVTVINAGTVRRMHSLINLLPSYVLPASRNRLLRLIPTVDMLTGVPSEVALRLAYWQSRASAPRCDMDPARDGCGLYWYSPLTPMKAVAVRDLVALVEKVCLKHSFAAPITLTAFSSRCFDVTVPILFDRAEDGANNRADQCYRELFKQGCARRFVPYRVGTQHMSLLIDPHSDYWKLLGRIKRLVDPGNILSPGRYSL